MSFKLLKQMILRQGVREFKDVVEVLDVLEEIHKQKLMLFEVYFDEKKRKISENEFKERFFKLTNLENFRKKLDILKQTFSHDSRFLKLFEKLQENLEEQIKMAFAKTVNYGALFLKLKEEGELLALEENLIEKAEKIQEQIETGFRIEETPMVFTIYGVEYLGKKVIVSWYKNLMDGGNIHTQNEWIRRKENSPDIALYHATFVALYENRTGPYVVSVERIRKMFKKDFEDEWMMTSTRIKYDNEGEDEIIHDYKNKNEYVVKAYVKGHSSFIESGDVSLELLNSLLGSRNKNEIVKVYTWLMEIKPFLFRLERKPMRTTERAVVLGCGLIGNRFNIDCVESINGHARKVVIGAPSTIAKI